MPTPTSTIEVNSSNEGGVFSVELLGRRLTRAEAAALARRLVALLDLGAEPGTETPAATAPPKFTPGLARSRLDHFLRATSGRPPEAEPRRAPDPAPAAPMHLGDPLVAPRAESVRQVVAQPAQPARRAAHAHDASSYVHDRAEEWWAKSSQPGLEPGVRAEARAIAAELFEIAVKLEGHA